MLSENRRLRCLDFSYEAQPVQKFGVKAKRPKASKDNLVVKCLDVVAMYADKMKELRELVLRQCKLDRLGAEKVREAL